MRAPVKLTALVLAAFSAAAIAFAGCGGGGGSGGGGGEPASLAPEKAPVYIEVNLAPEGKTSEEFNELTRTVLGIENVGEFIAEELEKAALGEGEKFNFEEEVEPWLGDKAGMYLQKYDGDEFNGYGAALETTNSDEAEEFIAERAEKEGSEKEEFEGDPFWASTDDESVIGLIDGYVAIGETQANFEEMVKVSESGEGLNESEKFNTAIDNAETGGLGSVYVDIGGLIEEAQGSIPPESEVVFDLAGIEPKKATAVATVVPHSEQLELDLSSNVGGSAPTGDASALLESVPATAIAAFAAPEVGKSFGEAIDKLNKEGIPGQIPPNQLKPALELVGINLDSIANSIGGVAGFLEGTSRENLGGAAVLETSDPTEAKATVASIGKLLRGTGTPGVTAIGGELAGFSIRSAELGKQPLIVGSAGEKIVIAYGPKAAARALKANAKTLGTTADFEAAKSALGSTPISSFIDGGPTLKLIEASISSEELEKLESARPYLQKITYAAIGSEASGEATNAKVIVGLQK